MIQMKNEITPAAPHLIPLDTTNTSLRGNAFNISMMVENNQPTKPAMRMTDQRSRVIVIYFPSSRERIVCRRSFQTLRTASRTIVPDIFELPA